MAPWLSLIRGWHRHDREHGQPRCILRLSDYQIAHPTQLTMRTCILPSAVHPTARATPAFATTIARLRLAAKRPVLESNTNLYPCGWVGFPIPLSKEPDATPRSSSSAAIFGVSESCASFTAPEMDSMGIRRHAFDPWTHGKCAALCRPCFLIG